MKILALDLGKHKSVFVHFVAGGGKQQFGTIGSNAAELEKLLRRVEPDRLVIEACPAAGWVCDLAGGLKIEVQVANGVAAARSGKRSPSWRLRDGCW